MKIYGPEELADADGKDGKPSLVAVNGQVYDLSASKKWPDGLHMKRHHAGGNLTSDLKSAPHGPDVLERFPCVGRYEEAASEAKSGLKGAIDAWLIRHPFFRRHPHPAVVHVPVGVIQAAAIFQVAALVTGSASTEWAAYCCLILTLLTVPAAITTGYVTWWLNYDLGDNPIIRRKRCLAWTALVVAASACVVRTLFVADPLRTGDPLLVIYLVLLALLAIIIGYVGFLGGRLTFPYE